MGSEANQQCSASQFYASSNEQANQIGYYQSQQGSNQQASEAREKTPQHSWQQQQQQQQPTNTANERWQPNPYQQRFYENSNYSMQQQQQSQSEASGQQQSPQQVPPQYHTKRVYYQQGQSIKYFPFILKKISFSLENCRLSLHDEPYLMIDDNYILLL